VQLITLETKIAAPPERCFLLSLSVDLHVESTAKTNERAIAGVTHGLIGLGESVTWQGRHFGLMLKHETLIAKYDKPRYFQDVMTRGMFRSFEHDHFFEPITGGTTLMRDELRFASPFGVAGRLVDRFVLASYLRRFLIERNEVIKRTAESPQNVWARFS
jgi:ligand-binding SRPBCC domain-containing protein